MDGEKATKELAFVLNASTSQGILAQLRDYSLTEDISTNSLAVIEGKKRIYLGIISETCHLKGSERASQNVSLMKEETGRRIAEITKESYVEKDKFSTGLRLIPLAQTNGKITEEVDTIPVHMAKVLAPSEKNIKIFYGTIDNKVNWGIGYSKHPFKEIESKVMIPLNIDILTRGSFGIFGKSGTGKTHLGNIISTLIVLFNKLGNPDKKIKLLIFDMHSEYGLKVKDEHGNDYADGVGLIFRNEFLRCSPDHALAKERGLEKLMIDLSEITIEDFYVLEKILGLSENFTAYLPSFRFAINKAVNEMPKQTSQIQQSSTTKQDNSWLLYLLGYLEDVYTSPEYERLEKKIGEYVKSLGPGALSALRAGKAKLRSLNRYEFLSTEYKENLNEIVNELFEGNRNIIISFGRYGDDPRAYILIAQLLAKRIWEKAIDEIMRGRRLENKILIFLEEAHKFLSEEFYGKTAFGNIARELRKRGVLLAIIDQRPSQIAEDVMAMLWNNFVLTLTEPRDIESATRGLKYSELFKPVVSTLKKREVLIFGEAVKLPAVVTIRDYREFVNEAKKIYESLVQKIDLPGY